MKILLFTADSRCFHYLAPIVTELLKRDHQYYFLTTAMTQIQNPVTNIDNYRGFKNFEPNQEDFIETESLGVLPFKPDFVILTRENWDPEQTIIRELKERFDCKIGLVEVNTHLINVIETKMEMISRNKYPQNMIDVFFDQSKIAIQSRIESGWKDDNRSFSVGNPILDQINNSTIQEQIKQKYNIDDNKKQIIFYSLINMSRNKSLQIIKNLSEKAGDDYQILYKPYPGEPYSEKYIDIFQPEFFLSNVIPIIDHIDLLSLQVICDIHIGAISSVMSVPLYLKKKIININNICRYLDDGNNLDEYKNENEEGYSDGSAKFWMRVHELETYEDFVELVNVDDIEKFKIRNKNFNDVIKETTIDYDEDLLCLKEDNKDNSKLLKMFDEFCDGKASERIINMLEVKVNEK